MTKIQTSNKPALEIPRISMFDKRGQANLSRFTKLTNIQTVKSNINLPKVRISQHKGS